MRRRFLQKVNVLFILASLSLVTNAEPIDASNDSLPLTSLGAGAFSVLNAPRTKFPTRRIHQRAELTDTVQKIGDWTGSTVAINGDTVVAGAPNQGNEPGAAYVFVKPASGWANMTQTAALTPSDGMVGDDFGDGVAVSGDTIFVSAQNLSAVYVFVKPLGGWTDMTQTAKLTASVGTSRFGLALACAGDTIVVGAYGTQEVGTAYVYVKPKDGWKDMQQTAELLATNKGDFGLAVAINGDTIVVGAPTAASQDGVVYVYLKPSGGWQDVEPTAALTASDATQGPNFGGSLSLSDRTILVGASFGGSQRTGETYIFVEPTGGWIDSTETARLEAPKAAQLFGGSVSLVGNTALVSSSESFFERGLVYVFRRPTDGWTTTAHFNAELLSSDGAAGDLFGAPLAADGRYAVVGAYEHNTARGAAYVFGL